MSKWLFRFREVTEEMTEGYEAFVYQITNTLTGRKYIGKKILLRKVTKKPLKGKTNKRHSKVKSDWETYWGSNKELLADIERDGDRYFTREILQFCKGRGEANYWEAKWQFYHDVLLKPEEWYNDWIMVKVHRRHVYKKK